MKNDPISFYQNTLVALSKSKSQLDRQISWLGWARLLVFFTAATAFYFTVSVFSLIHLALLVGATLVFLFLLLVNYKLSNQRELVINLILINNNELALFDHRPSCFDAGTAFLNDHSFLADLDIFGDRSLFHHLNRTTTQIGKERLASLLANPLSSAQAVEQQQAAVKELAVRTFLRQHFCAIGLRSAKNPPDYEVLQKWLTAPNQFVSSAKIRGLLFFAPLLMIGSVFVGWLTDNFWLIGYAIVANLMIAGAYTKKINEIHRTVSKNLVHFADFAAMLELLEREKFEASKLKSIQSDATEAIRQFKKLASLGDFFDQRSNLLVSFFLNAAFLFDIQCAFRLERWKLHNAKRLSLWLHSIAEMESLSSLATFCFNYPDHIFPTLYNGEPLLKAKNLAHPLIPVEECVTNDLSFSGEERLFIITGSNMSGKSTFLRTVGVNLLLSRIGAPVCASAMECSILDIYTSLRQTDSLLDHVSLFFSELRKLKSILTGLSTNPKALVLLDEVLRGTNSDDKLFGSQELVKKLVQMGCLTILATHDIGLSKMETSYPAEIKNCCFESSLENNQLTFDYRLKKGVSQNRNATFLMRQMGIID